MPELLEEMLDAPAKFEAVSAPLDLLIKVGKRRFAIEVQGQLLPESLQKDFKTLSRLRPAGSTPVIAVPALTEPRRAALRALGANWIDFAGNAHIRGEDIFIHVDGRSVPASVGRPASLFERRSSRLVRALLLEPARTWSVKQAAAAAGLEEGQTSRLLGRLRSQEFIERDASRAYKLLDPARLASAWRDAADFRAHTIHPAHVVGRAGSEITLQVAETLRTQGVRFAATGLSAAWAYDHFAMHRLSTFYVEKAPTGDLAAALRRQNSGLDGANVWLVVPNDDGVFNGTRDVDGLPCVHPVQVWVDLKGHPERAEDAAEHMRTEALLGFRP